MKMSKLFDVNFQNAMIELNSQSIPIKATLLLLNITDKMESEIKRFNEAKTKAITDSGIKNEKGELQADEAGNVKLSEDDKVRIEKELAEALDQELDMPKIKMSELGNKINMSVASLTCLKDDVILITE